jgi:hypothetical protein
MSRRESEPRSLADRVAAFRDEVLATADGGDREPPGSEVFDAVLRILAARSASSAPAASSAPTSPSSVTLSVPSPSSPSQVPPSVPRASSSLQPSVPGASLSSQPSVPGASLSSPPSPLPSPSSSAPSSSAPFSSAPSSSALSLSAPSSSAPSSSAPSSSSPSSFEVDLTLHDSIARRLAWRDSELRVLTDAGEVCRRLLAAARRELRAPDEEMEVAWAVAEAGSAAARILILLVLGRVARERAALLREELSHDRLAQAISRQREELARLERALGRNG